MKDMIQMKRKKNENMNNEGDKNNDENKNEEDNNNNLDNPNTNNFSRSLKISILYIAIYLLF